MIYGGYEVLFQTTGELSGRLPPESTGLPSEDLILVTIVQKIYLSALQMYISRCTGENEISQNNLS